MAKNDLFVRFKHARKATFGSVATNATFTPELIRAVAQMIFSKRKKYFSDFDANLTILYVLSIFS